MNAPALLAEAGITYRQLDYWVNQGYLRPFVAFPGTGKAREFPALEVRVAVRMAHLVAAGLQPQAAHGIARGDQQRAQRLRKALEETEWAP